MSTLIEIAYWIRIFLSPNFVVILIMAILYSVNDHFSYWYLVLFIPGIIIGIALAEQARKRHGTSNYYSKPMNTPDIIEKWEKDNKAE